MGSTPQAQSIARPFIERLNEVILFPLISLMMGVALLVFLWGVFEYVSKAESDDARATGRRHMLYGIIGFVVMVAAMAILKIATSTFGVSVP